MILSLNENYLQGVPDIINFDDSRTTVSEWTTSTITVVSSGTSYDDDAIMTADKTDVTTMQV